MRKFSKLLSVLLCMCILAGCFVLTGSATSYNNNTNKTYRLYGDINGNGVIEEVDYQYICDILSGAKEMPAVGSAEYYAADIMGDGITMEDARRCYRYLNGQDTVNTYCPQDRMLDLYNDLVNIIKSSDFMALEEVSYFNKSVMHTETNNFDFGPLYTSTIESIFKEEMQDEIDFSPLYKSTSVYYFENNKRTNFPMFDSSAVSQLTVADLKNITLEVGVPCKFSEEMSAPQTFVRGTTTYDVTPLTAQEAQYTDCIKFTVEIKDESYQRDLKNLPAESKTALFNFFGTDVRLLAKEYPFIEDASSDGMVMVMKMDLIDIQTSGKAIYYFDRATLNPICAGYVTTIDTNQNVEMNFGFEDITIDGTMEPQTINTNSYFYWFDKYISAE